MLLPVVEARLMELVVLACPLEGLELLRGDLTRPSAMRFLEAAAVSGSVVVLSSAAEARADRGSI